MDWGLLTSNLSFSSLYPCNTDQVNQIFRDAAINLDIHTSRRFDTVKDIYKELIKKVTTICDKIAPNSAIVDVPADGNCMFYCLAAPLIGATTPDKVCDVVINIWFQPDKAKLCSTQMKLVNFY